MQTDNEANVPLDSLFKGSEARADRSVSWPHSELQELVLRWRQLAVANHATCDSSKGIQLRRSRVLGPQHRPPYISLAPMTLP